MSILAIFAGERLFRSISSKIAFAAKTELSWYVSGIDIFAIPIKAGQMPGIIDVSQLVKTYGDGTKAVKGISFSVNEGEFFGFLGPNGAGKSTTIKILTTLLQKTSGSASVAGLSVDSDAAKIRKIIGVQNQDTVVDEDLTGRENLILQGQLQQMHGPAIKERVDELLKIVDLTDAADKRAGFYSGGMKKRLDLATTLVHNPKILFLDEPTTGLDPQSRAAIWAYLKRLNEQGITIFITTQYLDDVFLKHTGKRIRVEEVSSANSRGMFGRRRR